MLDVPDHANMSHGSIMRLDGVFRAGLTLLCHSTASPDADRLGTVMCGMLAACGPWPTMLRFQGDVVLPRMTDARALVLLYTGGLNGHRLLNLPAAVPPGLAHPDPPSN